MHINMDFPMMCHRQWQHCVRSLSVPPPSLRIVLELTPLIDRWSESVLSAKSQTKKQNGIHPLIFFILLNFALYFPVIQIGLLSQDTSFKRWGGRGEREKKLKCSSHLVKREKLANRLRKSFVSYFLFILGGSFVWQAGPEWRVI